MPIVGLSNFAEAGGGDGGNGKEMPPYGPGGIYHEKQIGSLCALHTVNNLLQGPMFTDGDFRGVAAELDRAERALMGGGSMDYGNARMDGFYNVQVVQAVLNRAGYAVEPINSEAARECQADTAKEKAFILNKREHWFSIRRIGREWFDLNSCLKTPRHYKDGDLRFHIRDAVREGYSVFVVRPERGDFPECALDKDHKKLIEAIQGCGSAEQGYSLFAGGGQTLSGPSSGGAAAAPAPASNDAAALRAARLARFGGGGGPAPPPPAAAPVAAEPAPTPAPAPAPPAPADTGKDPNIDTLVAMGFDAASAKGALEAAKGNVERAAEILLGAA
eukprot:gb/GFBE01021610.1/.p1 GENE.gb/GFBE01021610.1/~~gb/GFBE01021610.1/.p1  ORF type:complete len:332 (+),score=75.38 gb/GFBE01021610.1/:1-996(+)